MKKYPELEKAFEELEYDREIKQKEQKRFEDSLNGKTPRNEQSERALENLDISSVNENPLE